jgi:hypothetical protein
MDPVYLISYIFSHGPAPPQLDSADVDNSGDINVADTQKMYSYIFGNEPMLLICPSWNVPIERETQINNQ